MKYTMASFLSKVLLVLVQITAITAMHKDIVILGPIIPQSETKNGIHTTSWKADCLYNNQRATLTVCKSILLQKKSTSSIKATIQHRNSTPINLGGVDAGALLDKIIAKNLQISPHHPIMPAPIAPAIYVPQPGLDSTLSDSWW